MVGCCLSVVCGSSFVVGGCLLLLVVRFLCRVLLVACCFVCLFVCPFV